MEVELYNKYDLLYRTAVVNPNKIAAIKKITDNILFHKKRYEDLINTIKTTYSQSTIPWYFVAVVHHMEADCLFDRHLHNGDPLLHRTIHVPAGRPSKGNPPFTWEQSAFDALCNVSQLHLVQDWRIPALLRRIEGYNGFGYSNKGINSPYLWSYTSQYGVAPNIGKYISDGHFDPKAISTQIGAVAILKQLIN